MGRPLRIDQMPLMRSLLGGPRTTADLIASLPLRRGSSVRRSLDTLHRSRLIEPYSTSDGEAGWKLTPSGLEIADAEASDTPLSSEENAKRTREDDDSEQAGPSPVAHLRPHQSFVATNIPSSDIAAVLELLSTGKLGVEASAVVRLDGEAHAYLFLYESDLGAGPAERLSAALASRRLPHTLGTVADVRSFATMLRESRAAGQAAAAAEQAGSDTRVPSPDAGGAP